MGARHPSSLRLVRTQGPLPGRANDTAARMSQIIIAHRVPSPTFLVATASYCPLLCDRLDGTCLPTLAGQPNRRFIDRTLFTFTIPPVGAPTKQQQFLICLHLAQVRESGSGKIALVGNYPNWRNTTACTRVHLGETRRRVGNTDEL